MVGLLCSTLLRVPSHMTAPLIIPSAIDPPAKGAGQGSMAGGMISSPTSQSQSLPPEASVP
jgi:hypothetical protein